jgi:predicted  nucleic acid-binding Zn-ribbon protein
MSDHHPETSPETPPADHDQQQQQQPAQNAQKKKKEIKTFHCRYCSHLLLASTRSILSATTPLARRGGAARDRALILDIPARIRPTTTITATSAQPGSEEEEKEEEETAGSSEDTRMADGEAAGNTTEPGQTSQSSTEAHYTIPLATLLPDSKPVIIRRDDGFEKRILFKCGRCRVVVGYEIVPKTIPTSNENEDEKERVMYLLPGSLVGTEDLQEQGSAIETNTVLKQMEAEWEQWVAV